MGEDSAWLGERRHCWMRVSSFRETPGFGELPQGRGQGGELPRGVRARLFRGGALIAEDLRAGALIREKVIGTRLEARAAIGQFRRVAVAAGHGGVRADDQFEFYTRAEPAAACWAVPGEREVPLGRATVRGTADDPLAGPGAVAEAVEGRLRAGDRVRVVRRGRPLADALRLLLVTDDAGRPLDELAAGGPGTLYLGHPDLCDGDTVVAYAVPAPETTEERTSTLSVTGIEATGSVTRAVVLPIREYVQSANPAEGLAAGHRARVLRGRTVIADGASIRSVVAQGLLERSLRPGPNSKMRVAVDFPDLREGDWIEPYRTVPMPPR
ncbi:hypothetical protein SAMN05443665_1023105 [Actinomadura meyerae]|uniref:Uncharacterized protein n=1 Tax=Actinomadura meyerae TaxID=240840 RepID=A0A239LQX5_9ACTN|nr:hypothetical protein [Actinomadura meyerae]SNT32193.1 hypothetical protein SAMN05443665_1023105 [Actinomadura meyerae]